MASLVVTPTEMMKPVRIMMDGKVAMGVVAITVIVWVIGISIDGIPCTTRQC